MISGWKNVHLSDCLTLGNGKSRPLSYGGIPVYGGNGILDYCDAYNYSDGTIIIGRVGAYCGSVYISYDKIWISDNALSAKPLKNNDIGFLYYYLLNMGLNQFSEGSSHPLLTHSLLYSLDALIPEPDEQRAIAAVLSSFDDKIDLLHRQNATLEAMAETLFRQWFVVDAKQEWEEKSLSDIAVFLNGLPCQKFRPQNIIERLPVLKIKELSKGISTDSEWASNTVPQEYIVQFGDVIFSWSGSLMVKIWDGDNCVLNQHLFKVNSNNYPKWLYYFWCKQHLNEFISISESKATTMGHIKRENLDAAIVKVPSKNEICNMSAIIEPYLNKLMQNKAQINVLEKLRDTLLPKLMSGEVRVDF